MKNDGNIAIDIKQDPSEEFIRFVDWFNKPWLRPKENKTQEVKNNIGSSNTKGRKTSGANRARSIKPTTTATLKTELTCANSRCGKTFAPKHIKQIFCSEKCKNAACHYRLKDRRGASLSNIKCGWCGKEFTPKTISSRYCSKICGKRQWWDVSNKNASNKGKIERLKNGRKDTGHPAADSAQTVG